MKLKSVFLFIFLIIISCENNETLIKEKTLIVASKRISCVGLFAQDCFLAKEKGAKNWQYYYDIIIGLNYEEGFEYEILVTEKQIENPPEDASSIEISLIKIISKIKKTSENLPN